MWKSLYPFLSVIIGVGIGVLVGTLIAREWAKRLREKEAAEAENRIKQAEIKEQDVLQRAKEKAIKILEDARLEEKRGIEELKKEQATLIEREEAFSKKLLEIDASKQEVERLKLQTEDARREVEALRTRASELLEKTASMNKDEALAHLLKQIEEEQQEILLNRLRKVEEMTADEIEIGRAHV